MPDNTLPDVLTDELGQPGNIPRVWDTRGFEHYEPQPSDPNPEMRFPRSAKVFEEMRESDGQIGSVLRAVMQPIMWAKWELDTASCSDEVG